VARASASPSPSWGLGRTAIGLGSTVGDFSSTPVVNVVGGALKGASSITVADASRFNVGDILQIDQVADGTANGPVGWVWKLDSWWSCIGLQLSGGGSGASSPAPNGYRPSLSGSGSSPSGNTLTIYDPAPAAANTSPSAAMDPRSGAPPATPPTSSLQLKPLRWSAASSGARTWFMTAPFSWIKDIGPTAQEHLGRPPHPIETPSQVRAAGQLLPTQQLQPGLPYGILYSGSDCLIEDNIVRELNKPILGETAGGGNVIAYNYVDEAIIGSLTDTWQETAINMSHGSFCHSDLFEGNHTPNVGVDSTHGNNGWGVIFRNWATGRNSSAANTYLRHLLGAGSADDEHRQSSAA
jgi:hypothetical protein